MGPKVGMGKKKGYRVKERIIWYGMVPCEMGEVYAIQSGGPMGMTDT